MYRWRVALRQKEQKAIAIIDDISTYLTYDVSTPRAVTALATISQRITAKLIENRVQIVK